MSKTLPWEANEKGWLLDSNHPEVRSYG